MRKNIFNVVIYLSFIILTIISIQCCKKPDNDGMPDEWEKLYGLNMYDASDANLDKDNDGLTNLEEYQKGTIPTNPDSDGDGLKDGDEIRAGTKPLRADSDNDGFKDGEEIQNGTNPLVDEGKEKFDLLVKRGQEALSVNNFAEAQTIFSEAIAINDYRGNKNDAEQGLEISKIALGDTILARNIVEQRLKYLGDEELDQAIKGKIDIDIGNEFANKSLKEFAPKLARAEKKNRQEAQQIIQASEKRMRYSLINEDFYQTTYKTQMRVSILVNKEIYETELEQVLQKVFEKYKAKTGFKYHDHLTHIAIYALTDLSLIHISEPTRPY